MADSRPSNLDLPRNLIDLPGQMPMRLTHIVKVRKSCFASIELTNVWTFAMGGGSDVFVNIEIHLTHKTIIIKKASD